MSRVQLYCCIMSSFSINRFHWKQQLFMKLQLQNYDTYNVLCLPSISRLLSCGSVTCTNRGYSKGGLTVSSSLHWVPWCWWKRNSTCKSPIALEIQIVILLNCSFLSNQQLPLFTRVQHSFWKIYKGNKAEFHSIFSCCQHSELV